MCVHRSEHFWNMIDILKDLYQNWNHVRNNLYRNILALKTLQKIVFLTSERLDGAFLFYAQKDG